MIDCKNLIIEDITPWHGDVFDHPIYEYSYKLSKKKIISHIHCNYKRCKDYVHVNEDESMNYKKGN